MILIFKTSVDTKAEIEIIKPHLNQIIPSTNWNIDTEDCDKVLRIISKSDVTPEIIELFKDHGFICKEM